MIGLHFFPLKSADVRGAETRDAPLRMSAGEATLPFYGGEKTNTKSSITFTFTILQAFPLCKAYMLRFGQVHP